MLYFKILIILTLPITTYAQSNAQASSQATINVVPSVKYELGQNKNLHTEENHSVILMNKKINAQTSSDKNGHVDLEQYQNVEIIF